MLRLPIFHSESELGALIGVEGVFILGPVGLKKVRDCTLENRDSEKSVTPFHVPSITNLYYYEG